MEVQGRSSCDATRTWLWQQARTAEEEAAVERTGQQRVKARSLRSHALQENLHTKRLVCTSPVLLASLAHYYYPILYRACACDAAVRTDACYCLLVHHLSPNPPPSSGSKDLDIVCLCHLLPKGSCKGRLVFSLWCLTGYHHLHHAIMLVILLYYLTSRKQESEGIELQPTILLTTIKISCT